MTLTQRKIIKWTNELVCRHITNKMRSLVGHYHHMIVQNSQCQKLDDNESVVAYWAGLEWPCGFNITARPLSLLAGHSRHHTTYITWYCHHDNRDTLSSVFNHQALTFYSLHLIWSIVSWQYNKLPNQFCTRSNVSQYNQCLSWLGYNK